MKGNWKKNVKAGEFSHVIGTNVAHVPKCILHAKYKNWV